MAFDLTIHLPRRREHALDITVDTAGSHDVADLRKSLEELLGEPVPTLAVAGRTLEENHLLGMPPLVHGASLVAGSRRPSTPLPVTSHHPLVVAVTSGPDAGLAIPLHDGELVLGRHGDPGGIEDPSLSRRHLQVRTSPDGVCVEDLGSTNGTYLSGHRIAGPTTWPIDEDIAIGRSILRLRRRHGVSLPVRPTGDGYLEVDPPSRADQPSSPTRIDPPRPPERPRPARIPWVGALIPLPFALGLAYFLGPQLLAFALLGPLALLATAASDRWGSRRQVRTEAAAYAVALAEAEALLDAGVVVEAAARAEAAPDAHIVLAVAEERGPRLWERRRGDPDFGTARIGLGPRPTGVLWGDVAAARTVDATPLTVRFGPGVALGVCGPGAEGVLRFIVGQLATWHGPDDLRLAVGTGSSDRAPWHWIDRLPHRGDVTPDGALRVEVAPDWASIDPGDREALRELVTEGGSVVVGACRPQDLPGWCTETIGDRWGPDDVPDEVGPWWVDRLARALAPLRPGGRTSAGGSGLLPAQVGLEELIGIDATDVEAILDRWQRFRSGVRGIIGRGENGPLALDLATDGPHVLVGGTTGSGKSEFLQTLVVSLALEAAPSALTFVLVDYKGGAGFAPYAVLPHVLGVVTDLDAAGAARALASLTAELKHRERQLAEVGAKDFGEYQRLDVSSPVPLPRLVIVIDEFRLLVDELPQFVTGLVHLAAIGRSLGVHLVLATQRPAGAVSASIQSNLNLRVAFRMRDAADSHDVIGDSAAAALSPSTPGRAILEGAQSRAMVQTALLLPPTDRSTLVVRRAHGDCRVAGESGDADPRTHRDAVLAALVAAGRSLGGPAPRPAWLPPLPATIAIADVPPGVVAVADDPTHQRRHELRWTLGGSWVLAGPPGSGRTEGLRRIVEAAADRAEPYRLHVHVIDATGALAALGSSPHVGTLVAPGDHRTAARLVARLAAEVRDRESTATSSPSEPEPPELLLVIDGWERLVELAQAQRSLTTLTDDVLALRRDGRGRGLRVVISAATAAARGRLGTEAQELFLLGAPDPVDLALLGLRKREASGDCPPGRGIHTRTGHEVQWVRPRPTALVVGTTRGPALPNRIVIRPLPTTTPTPNPSIRRSADGRLSISLGVGGDDARPIWWQLPADPGGAQLLVAGPSGSGRSGVLGTLRRAALDAGAVVATVGLVDGDPAARFDAADPEPLADFLREHPGCWLLVDDVDTHAGTSAEAVLVEAAHLVAGRGGLVAAVTDPSTLLTRFRGLDVELARRRHTLALHPTSADTDLLLGTRSSALPVLLPLAAVPGRGLLAQHGHAVEIQTHAPPTEPARWAPGPTD